MDHLTALIERIRANLLQAHAEMSPTEWQAFATDLARLQPKVDGAADENLRIDAFYELYETCLRYQPFRRQLPRDPTMLAGPPEPRPKDEPIEHLDSEPRRNRVSDIIERIKEIGSPQPPPAPPKKTGDST
jgi:hypothetical protein